jgi:glycosyltransferase involved in cell wall biosynthesis
MRHVLVSRYGAAAWRLASAFDPTIVVVLGHTLAGPLALAAWLRLKSRALTLYMGDTNGYQLARDLADGARTRALLGIKRMILPGIFHGSLDLGASNSLANRSMGIEVGVPIPLYSTDFAAIDASDVSECLFPDCQVPRLLCLARLVPAKNLPALVMAWRRRVEYGGPGSLLIAGEGPERGRLRALIDDMPPDRIRLLGPVPRPAIGSLLGQVDGLVLPSLRESWGIAVVEALGSGLPVLATVHVGAAISLAPEHSDAISLCSADLPSLSRALDAFMQRLVARERVSNPTRTAIRDRYGMLPVAARLHDLGEAWVRERLFPPLDASPKDAPCREDQENGGGHHSTGRRGGYPRWGRPARDDGQRKAQGGIGTGLDEEV